MKKILSILTIFIMIFSVVAQATTITVDYEFDSENNSYVVFGNSTDTKSGDEITIEVYLGSTLIDTIVTETINSSETKSYKSPVIPIDALKPDGDITFKVYSANWDSAVTTAASKYYGMNDNLFTLLQAVNNAISTDNYEALIATLSTDINAEILGVDYTLASTLNSNVNSVYAMKQYISSTTLSPALPSQNITDTEKKQTFENLLSFRSEFEKMLLVGEFANMKSSSDVTTWYKKYNAILDFESGDQDKFNYFKDYYTSAKYFEVINGESMVYGDIASLKERALDAAGLTKIATGNPQAVSEVFGIYSDKITKSYALNPVQEGTVFSNLSGNAYSSFPKLSNAYNTQAYDILYPNGNISTPSVDGEGGSFSSGGSVKIEPITEPVKGIDVPKVDEIFTDIGTATWAKTAIYTLYNKGIISGKTATTFDPNNYITRAEFIKMLVLIKGITPISSENVFSDINPSDWFADYVNNAYILNITKGYEDGTFRPYDKITREDMAVMIYRLLELNNENVNLSQFTDGEMISEYAKAAVSSLSEAKIINGMGNGMFSPDSFATRAQAAQMIYNFVK